MTDFRYGADVSGFTRAIQTILRGYEALNDGTEEAARRSQQLNRSLENLFDARSARQLQAATREIERLGAATQQIGARNTSRQLTDLQRRLGGIQVNAQNAAQTARDFGVELRRIGTQNRGIANIESGLRSLQRSLTDSDTLARRLGRSFRDVAKSVQFSAVFQAINAAQSAISNATDEAIRFNRAIAEIQTIDTSNFGFANIQAQLRGLSDEFGIAAVDEAEAAYQALSNQITDAANSYEFLRAANELAVVAVTDASTAVNTLSSVINSFGLTAQDAERISAQLFKVVELGRVRLEEIANTFGRIGVPAANLGLTFSELSATIAVITRRGVRFNEAATFLRGIFQQLTNPGTELAEVLERQGFASGEAAIQTLGLARTLSLIQEETGGASTEIAELFRRIRAITGIQIFDTQGIQDFEEAFEQINEIDLDEFQNKIDTVLGNAGTTVAREANRIRNFFTVDIGQTIVDTIAEASAAIGGFDAVLSALGRTLNVLTVPAILALAAATGSAIQGLVGVTTASAAASGALTGLTGSAARAGIALRGLLLANPILAAVTALTAGLVFFSESAVAAAEEQERLNLAWFEARQATLSYFDALDQRQLNEFADATRELQQAVGANIAATLGEINREQDQIEEGLEDTLQLVEVLGRESNNAIRQRLRALGTEFSQFVSGAASATRQFEQLQQRIDELDFQGTLQELGLQPQLDAVEARIEELRQQSLITQDPREFQQVSAQINALSREREQLVQRVGQAELDFAERVARTQAQAAAAFEQGDVSTFERLNNILADLNQKREAALTLTAAEAQQRFRVVDATRALANAEDSRQPEATLDALRRELGIVLQQEQNVRDQIEKQNAARAQSVNLLEEQAQQAERIAQAQAAQAAEIERQRLQNQVRGQVLAGAISRADDFDRTRITEEESSREVNRAAEEQIANLREIAALQEELNISARETTDLKRAEEQIEALRANRQRQIFTQRAQQTLPTAIEGQNERARTLQESARELTPLRDFFAALSPQLRDLVNSLETVNREAVAQTLSGDAIRRGTEFVELDPETGRGVNRAFERAAPELISALENTVTAINQIVGGQVTQDNLAGIQSTLRDFVAVVRPLAAPGGEAVNPTFVLLVDRIEQLAEEQDNLLGANNRFLEAIRQELVQIEESTARAEAQARELGVSVPEPAQPNLQDLPPDQRFERARRELDEFQNQVTEFENLRNITTNDMEVRNLRVEQERLPESQRDPNFNPNATTPEDVFRRPTAPVGAGGANLLAAFPPEILENIRAFRQEQERQQQEREQLSRTLRTIRETDRGVSDGDRGIIDILNSVDENIDRLPSTLANLLRDTAGASLGADALADLNALAQQQQRAIAAGQAQRESGQAPGSQLVTPENASALLRALNQAREAAATDESGEPRTAQGLTQADIDRLARAQAEAVAGSGPGGLITQEDQLRAFEQARIDQINAIKDQQLQDIQDIKDAQIASINDVRRQQIEDGILGQFDDPREGQAEAALARERGGTIAGQTEAQAALDAAREQGLLAQNAEANARQDERLRREVGRRQLEAAQTFESLINPFAEAVGQFSSAVEINNQTIERASGPAQEARLAQDAAAFAEQFQTRPRGPASAEGTVGITQPNFFASAAEALAASQETRERETAIEIERSNRALEAEITASNEQITTELGLQTQQLDAAIRASSGPVVTSVNNLQGVLDTSFTQLQDSLARTAQALEDEANLERDIEPISVPDREAEPLPPDPATLTPENLLPAGVLGSGQGLGITGVTDQPQIGLAQSVVGPLAELGTGFTNSAEQILQTTQASIDSENQLRETMEALSQELQAQRQAAELPGAPVVEADGDEAQDEGVQIGFNFGALNENALSLGARFIETEAQQEDFRVNLESARFNLDNFSAALSSGVEFLRNIPIEQAVQPIGGAGLNVPIGGDPNLVTAATTLRDAPVEQTINQTDNSTINQNITIQESRRPGQTARELQQATKRQARTLGPRFKPQF